MFLSIELPLKISGASVRVKWKFGASKWVNYDDGWCKTSGNATQSKNRMDFQKRKRTTCALAGLVSDRPLNSVQIRETPVA